MASMLARVGRNASARSLSAIQDAATALPAAAAASRAARSGNAGGVPVLDGRSVASKRLFPGCAHHEGRLLLSTHSVHRVNSVAGQEDRDEYYDSPGLMKADDKDLESDEALWALYHRWCKYFKIERSLEEMTQRFGEFKETVLSLREERDSKNSSRIHINSLADRCIAELASRRTLVSYEAYLAAKAMQGCIITCESDED